MWSVAPRTASPRSDRARVHLAEGRCRQPVDPSWAGLGRTWNEVVTNAPLVGRRPDSTKGFARPPHESFGPTLAFMTPAPREGRCHGSADQRPPSGYLSPTSVSQGRSVRARACSPYPAPWARNSATWRSRPSSIGRWLPPTDRPTERTSDRPTSRIAPASTCVRRTLARVGPCSSRRSGPRDGPGAKLRGRSIRRRRGPPRPQAPEGRRWELPPTRSP